MTFLINEIFTSIQGEGTRAGRLCLFIRTAGCSLRCRYCDTTYAFSEGRPMSGGEILREVHRRIGLPGKGPNAPFVEITGGEPLDQAGTPALMQALLEGGYEVALETAGSHDLSVVPRDVVKIADRKTPGSGMSQRWLESNLDCLVSGQDELKFVLCGEDDYAWARTWCLERGILDRLDVLFSPVWGKLDPRWLAERIVADALPVRFQLQLHKLVWPPEQRGV
ncbi:radical SAM protein [Holophaga foetida]|uniref:radical SAM protein n=1 Tax=Holophaga foetida TaxID=35839 RepID=UPI0002474A3D|nr:radical SAM protein [Holophaga foetida]